MVLHKSTFLPFLLVIIFFNNSAFAASLTLNVLNYGAKPDAKIDSSKAFELAWAQACRASTTSHIYVPKGRFYLRSATFHGPCNNHGITIRIDGTLVAPSDIHGIGNSENWILFHLVSGVTILGGVLDGQGNGLWACKNSGKTCPRGATSLEFTDSENIMISGLTSQNSQMFHIVVNECRNVRMQELKVLAPDDSPNTDGIHLGLSSYVTILNSNIGTGDDCISIGPGTSNVWIENVACGPGHGISIGSLGKELKEEGVENVTVRSSRFINTQNGVRIKSWGRPSTGFAKNIRFQHLTMTNVKNPIIIDQNYCPHNKNCPGQVSGVKVRDVTYEDIHGTSATQVAMKFDCSSKVSCSGIRLKDIKLTYNNAIPKISCSNVGGTAAGLVQKMSCFLGNS